MAPPPPPPQEAGLGLSLPNGDGDATTASSTAGHTGAKAFISTDSAPSEPTDDHNNDLHSSLSTQYPLSSDLPPTKAPPVSSSTSPSASLDTSSESSVFAALKSRIALHYNLASDYYYSLWGEHIHHGYFTDPADTKERAQGKLIELLLERADLRPAVETNGGPGTGTEVKQLDVLDVGCGIGGTSRRLARDLGARVTGITISKRQVEIAERITREEGAEEEPRSGDEKEAAMPPVQLQLGSRGGTVSFLELDAEEMGSYFGVNNEEGSSPRRDFDIVWISEALSHFPRKELFFRNAHALLRPGGKLVIADWFKAEELSESEMERDIRPIEDGMLLPPLCTQKDYVRYATQSADLETYSPPMDISAQVAPTWDISWSLVQKPALWAFALSQGRDGIAFLQAFRAMRRGFANGTFRYAVMVFQKTKKNNS